MDKHAKHIDWMMNLVQVYAMRINDKFTEEYEISMAFVVCIRHFGFSSVLLAFILYLK